MVGPHVSSGPGRRLGAGRQLLALVGVLLLGWGCGRGEGAAGGGRGPAAAPVVVAAVVEKPVPVDVRTVGTAEARRTVSILPQVGGQIREVHFKEGDAIAQDALLFTIDTRPYRATLSEARARLAKDQALAKQAQEQADRAEKLRQEGLISQQDYERARSEADAQDATLRADRAAVTGATIDVDYATIRSPIAGRSGSLLVHAGNVVKPADKPLVVIRQIQPILVRFAVPEQYLPQVRQRMAVEPLPVLARPRGHDGEPAEGVLTFIENAVDATTGTIEMKAEFDNADELLWPGQFIEVTLRLSTQPKALVIPDAAVQSSQDGDRVFVIADGNRAELRRVSIARQVGSELVVASGLRAGERVVIDGQVRLTPGSLVEIKQPLTPAGGPSASQSGASGSSAGPPPPSTSASAPPPGAAPRAPR